MTAPRGRKETVADRLRARIAFEGPLTVAAYMAESLGSPDAGYYMRGDPLGPGGDFVTAPEISQMFGELLGLWAAQAWHDMGRPAPVNLVELGPGRGTLLADAWRAAAVAPDFRAAVRIHLVETSPSLREIQRATLAGIAPPVWHDDIGGVPDGPMLLIANEMFDALPIHQLVRRGDAWHERLIAAVGDGFGFVLDRSPSPRAALLPPALRPAPEDSIAEVSPAGISLAHEIGRRVAAHAGAALIVDYGPQRSTAGDTFQAVLRHRRHDPLVDPGRADLTAHVDFETLAGVARDAGARVCGPVPQGDFLARLGIESRAAALVRNATPTQAAEIATACRRLIHADEMGTLFKALAIVSPGLPVPPGFMTPSEERSEVS